MIRDFFYLKIYEIKIMKTTRLFKDFFQSEKAGGLTLIFCTLISLFLANTSFGANYIGFWNTEVAHHSFSHWINDGLMAVFFLLIGLELEREIYIGELSNLKSALLPISGALGGMLLPAGLFLLLNFGTATQSGAGIPMAKAISVAIGIPAPDCVGVPKLSQRKSPAGTSIPPKAAMTGKVAFFKLESSPK